MLYASSNAQSASTFPDTTARHAGRPTILTSAVNAVAGTPFKLAAALIRRRAIARQIAALEALDDRLLADIGIARWQIRRMVLQGRDPRGLDARDILS
jgi:uncharacterized protein YjiS (DUF1127 family)